MTLLTLLRPPDVPPVPPPPSPWIPRVTAGCYAFRGGLLASLDNAHDLRWQEQLNDVGSGEAQLNLIGPGGVADPDVANLPYRSLLRFSLDGIPRFQSVIEQKQTMMVALGEEVDQLVKVSGRGSLAVFEDAVVYPTGGLGWQPFSDRRIFDYSCLEDNEALWPDTPVVIKAQDSPFDPYGGAPTNWPDHTAEWIWGVGGPAPYPVGDCYFATRIFLPQETNVAFFATADDGFELRVDGAVALSAQPGSGTQAYVWASSQTTTLFLSAGVHKIAIKGTNVARPSSPSTNVAAVIFTCYAVDANGQLLPPPSAPTGPVLPIVHSDATWNCWSYPTVAPALPLGEAFHFVFDEAKARGCFGGTPGTGAGAYVDLGFSDTQDTAGNNWPIVEVGFGVGDSLLTAIKQMASSYACDFRMRPDTLVLDAYLDLGSDVGTLVAASWPGPGPNAGANLSGYDLKGQV